MMCCSTWHATNRGSSSLVKPTSEHSWRSHDGSRPRSSCSEAATTEPQNNRSRSFLEHLDDLADDVTTGAVAVITDERIRVRRLPGPPLLHNE